MMTPHDFLRSITPGIQQPANKGLDQFTNITKNDINSLAKDFKVDQSSIFNHLGSGISIFMIIKYCEYQIHPLLIGKSEYDYICCC